MRLVCWLYFLATTVTIWAQHVDEGSTQQPQKLLVLDRKTPQIVAYHETNRTHPQFTVPFDWETLQAHHTYNVSHYRTMPRYDNFFLQELIQLLYLNDDTSNATQLLELCRLKRLQSDLTTSERHAVERIVVSIAVPLAIQNPRVPHCTWKGVTCGVLNGTELQVVTSLVLGETGPLVRSKGEVLPPAQTLPTQLGQLEFLSTIKVQYTQTYRNATLPTELWSMPYLRHVHIHHAHLHSVSLPKSSDKMHLLDLVQPVDYPLPMPDLTQWSKLHTLRIQQEEWKHGHLEYVLARVPTTLHTLDLSRNNLTGPWNTIKPGLRTVQLSHNYITGTLPSVYATKLYSVQLSHNQLHGSLPQWSARLQTLDLSDNQLTGTLGDALAATLHLESLNLDRNQFTGSIPVHLYETWQHNLKQYVYE